MKKNRKKTVVLLLLYFGIITAKAQQATTAAGGNATGSGGSVAFSVGQIVYTTNTGTTGSVAQGVQQPYEISIVLGIEDNLINLDMQAYPNPTTNYLQLVIGSENIHNLTYQLFDIAGKVIENKKITKSIEIIHMENLPSASYFLTVTNNIKEIKTFKIIKN